METKCPQCGHPVLTGLRDYDVFCANCHYKRGKQPGSGIRCHECNAVLSAERAATNVLCYRCYKDSH